MLFDLNIRVIHQLRYHLGVVSALEAQGVKVIGGPAPVAVVDAQIANFVTLLSIAHKNPCGFNLAEVGSLEQVVIGLRHETQGSRHVPVVLKVAL